MNSGRIESELKQHGVYASNTLGVSMRPLFKTHRDMIVVVRPKEELKKYDVALYVSPRGKYVLHRVIKVRKDKYLIRGDNTYSIEHVPKSAVIGVLVKFNRNGKSYTVTSKGYRIYSRIWNFIYPIRFIFYNLKRIFIKVKRVLTRIYRAIFKCKK